MFAGAIAARIDEERGLAAGLRGEVAERQYIGPNHELDEVALVLLHGSQPSRSQRQPSACGQWCRAIRGFVPGRTGNLPKRVGSARMRIATWNINSIRTRVDQVVAWSTDRAADVVLCRKPSAVTTTFRSMPSPRRATTSFTTASTTGTALRSPVGSASTMCSRVSVAQSRPRSMSPASSPRPAEVSGAGRSTFPTDALDDPHYLYKLVWLERLRGELQQHRAAEVTQSWPATSTSPPLIVMSTTRRAGDAHASPPERDAVRRLLELGLIDLARDRHPDTPEFTWWNYRPGQFDKDHGLRIDLALCSSVVADKATGVWVDRRHAHERPSDHAPLVVDLVL